jgi:hypothetical protein
LLDFALLDNDSAVSVFSDYKDQQRRFYVILNVPAVESRVAGYVALHKDLVSECWLANECFCKAHNLMKSATRFEDAKKPNKDKPNARSAGHSKVIRIDRLEQIGPAVEFIRGLRRKNMLYWDEVVSQDVIDLEGSWAYVVSGTASDGKTFKHRGTCQAVIEGRGAHFIGHREETVDQDGNVQRLSQPAPWRSSPIEFGQDGWMEYKSVITLEGQDLRGIVRIKFATPGKRRLEGGMDLVVERGKAVYAEVVLERTPAAQNGSSSPTTEQAVEPGEVETAVAV